MANFLKLFLCVLRDLLENGYGLVHPGLEETDNSSYFSSISNTVL